MAWLNANNIRPASEQDRELLAHPGSEAWLGATKYWPGWRKLAVIAKRLGEAPDMAALQQVYDAYLLNYDRLKIGAVLDWYDLRRERGASWTPRDSIAAFHGQNGTSAPSGGGRPDKNAAALEYLRQKIIAQEQT